MGNLEQRLSIGNNTVHMSGEDEEPRVAGVPIPEDDDEAEEQDDILLGGLSLFTPQSVGQDDKSAAAKSPPVKKPAPKPVKPPSPAKPAASTATTSGTVEIDEGMIEEARVSNIPPKLPPVPSRVQPPSPPLPVKRGAPPKPPPPPPAPPTAKPAPVVDTSPGRVSDPLDFGAVLSAPIDRPATEDFDDIPGFPLPSSEPVGGSAEKEPETKSSSMALVLVALLIGGGAAAYFFVLRPQPQQTEQRAQLQLEAVEVSPQSPEQAEPEPEPDTESPAAVATEEPPVEEPTSMSPTEVARTSEMAPNRTTMQRAPSGERPTMEAVMTVAPAPMQSSMDSTSPYYERPAPTRMAASMEDLPAHPSREQVQAALTAVRPAVAACASGQRGTVRVLVTVAGSGRVTTALVQDDMWARPPTGSCMARAVRTARFPRFSEDRFRVLYPFQF